MMILWDLRCGGWFKRAFARSRTCEDPFNISDDSDGLDGLDDGIDLGLDDEPGFLLDYLQTRREVVKRRGI